MTFARTLGLLSGTILATVVLSCSTHERATSAGTAPRVAASSGFDIATLRDARYGFRESGDALVAGSSGHVVRVAKSGSIRFSPRRQEKHRHSGLVPLDEPSVELSTTTISRDRALDLGRAATHVSADGTVTIDRGFVSERIENGRRGLEQSWRFAAAPPGRGDLVVRVALTSKGRIEEQSDAIRIVDPSSRRAVAYEHATWVDAAGTKTTLPMHLEPGAPAHAVLRVPADIVARSTYPAVLDPTVSAEVAYDAPTVSVPTDTDGWDVAAAGGKNGSFLVAWTDERFLTVDDTNYFSSRQIIGARVAANGTILDPTAILIMSPRDFESEMTRIAFDGTNWIVFWQQYSMNGPCDEIVGTRVSEAGVVLDPKNIVVTCTISSTTFDIGYDGGAFLLSWNGQSKTSPGAGAQWGQYISTSGALASKAPFAIIDAMGNGRHVFACDGATRCVDVRPGASGLLGRSIANGGIIGSDVAITATAGDSPTSMSFDGTSFVIGYLGAGGTRAIRVDPTTLAPIAGDANGVAITPRTYGVSSASVTGQTLFAWPDANSNGNLAAVRLPSAGAPDAAPTVLTTSGNVSPPTLAGSADQYLAAWEVGYSGDPLPMIRISKEPKSLDGNGVPLRRAANGEQHPAVAGDASGWLVAWEDYGAGQWSSSVRAVRIDGTGAPIDASSFELFASGEYPDVASSGNGYLVVSSSVNTCTQIIARTVSKTGASPTIGAPVVIAPACALAARATFDGTDYVVAWEGTGGVNIARVGTDGTVIAKKVIGDQPSGYNGGLDVGTNGQDLFVAWSYDTGPNVGIRAARLAKDFTILDTPAITISTQNNYAYAPSVAWDGKSYLVVWEDYRNSLYSNADIYLARVSPAGKVLDPDGVVLGSGPINQQWPAVVSMNDGTSLVAWAEARRPDRYRDYGLFGTFVRTADGAILDPGGRELADTEGNEIFPALAAGAPGNALLTFHRNDMASGVGAARVRGRFVSAGVGVGKACTESDACASRACVDGVCCEVPCGGSCETCSATPGKCTKVTNADDADTCTGDLTCGAAGECKTKPGHTCATPTDCVSGFCEGTVCCDRPCNGACETCTATPGTCSPRTARSLGAPSCAPYACDGKGAQCPTKCESNDSCPTGSRCDAATGTCIEGAFCVDTRTLASNGATTTDCAPYACASGACRTTCRDVRDCVAPALCDETGNCVPPTTAPIALQSGCAMASARSTSSSRAVAIVTLVALAIVVARRRRRDRDGSSVSSAGP